jgi:hypothetical protein
VRVSDREHANQRQRLEALLKVVADAKTDYRFRMPTSGQGREDVADVSRLCRAFLTIRLHSEATNPDEALAEPALQRILSDVEALAVPVRSLQMMAAYYCHLSQRLGMTYAKLGGDTPHLIEDLHAKLVREGDVHPNLIEACFSLVYALRDEPRRLAEVERWGRTAAQSGPRSLLLLASCCLRTARTIVLTDPEVDDVEALLSTIAIEDEINLMNHGEA